MKYRTAKIYLAIAFCFPLLLSGQPIPDDYGFVNDFKQILTTQQWTELNGILTQYAESTSNEIAVAILDLPENEEIVTYTNQVARKWGIGGEKNNNGVLLAIYPNVKRLRIEVGYGLEGAIPDIAAKVVIDQDIRPFFKQNDYYGGVKAGVEVLMKLANGEYTDAEKRKYYSSSTANSTEVDPGAIFFIIILLFFVFYFISRNRGGGGGGKNGRGYYRGGTYTWGGPIWWGGGSSWGGGGGGWGSSDSGGGGDWGGFGGGDFGGGGASGDW